MTTWTRTLRLGVADQTENRYVRVPFELNHADSLEVRIALSDGAVVDLGCEGPAGWRGWSGGARRRYMISATEATPGYCPGELEDGEWAVILGLHQLPADPVEIQVEISTPALGPVEDEPDAPAADDRPRGSARGLPSPGDGLTWYAGDFHNHTLHSDGKWSISQVAAAGVAQGLDFMAITDHNTVSHHPHLPGVGATYGIELIPGQEVTSHRGHANAFGDIGWIEFRRPGGEWLADVDERGGLFSVNHPIDVDCSWLDELPFAPHAAEIWHISWFKNLIGNGMWGYWRLLGFDVPAIGGSDFHDPSQLYRPGLPVTWVAAEACESDAILAAVRAGRTAITAATQGAALIRLGDELLALDASGMVLVDSDGRRAMVTSDWQTFQADKTGPGAAGIGPYRLELYNRTLMAITR